MSLSAEEQLIIDEHVAGKCAAVPEAGFIIPAPIQFTGDADLFAQISAVAPATQKLIEMTEIAFTVITETRPPDRPEIEDDPWTFFHNLHVFRQYGLTRLDENIAPDDYKKRVLKSWTLFRSAVRGLSGEFYGKQPIPGLPESIVQAYTRLEIGADFFGIFEPDKFLKQTSVTGFSADIPFTVTILFQCVE